MGESQEKLIEIKITDQMTDYELLQLLDMVEQNEMLQAPSRMKDEIIKQSQKPSVALEITGKKVSKQVQLFWYSLRVSAAVAGALVCLLVLSLPSDFITSHIPEQPKTKTEWDITNKLYQGSNKVTSYLDEITSSIFNNNNMPEGR